MKRFMTIVIILVTLICSYQAKCKKEAYNWYFGTHAGITFLPDGNNPSVLYSSMMETFEGCSTISDSSGNLLFYTNGVTVWNKSHQIMPNGQGLYGSNSASQSSLVVPVPGNPNIFCLFTVACEETPSAGMCYSIVDMSLQGGLGDITTKNVQLMTSATEKITAVKHSNNRDIWILAHEWNNDAYYIYKISPAGLDVNPKIIHIGSVITGDPWNKIGYMKVSSNGKKLAIVMYRMGVINIFDFNNTTGDLTNPLILNNNDYYGAYGIEFSPDCSKLYLSNHGAGKLFQLNLKAGSANDIVNSASLISNNSQYNFGALQLGPDSKIYQSKYMYSYLGVINNPDSLGSKCNYLSDGIYLGGNKCQLGLPQFIQSYFNSTPLRIIGDSIICENGTVILSSESEYKSYLWSTGDTTRDILVTKPGNYSLRVTNGFGDFDSSNYNVTKFDMKLNNFKDVVFKSLNNGKADSIIFEVANFSNENINIDKIYIKGIEGNTFSVKSDIQLPVVLSKMQKIVLTVKIDPKQQKQFLDSLFFVVSKPCYETIAVACKVYDAFPPKISFVPECNGDISIGIVTDMPSDSLYRSNLGKIILDSAKSFNYILNVDNYNQGISEATHWSLKKINKNQKGKAVITFSDNAGNDTTATIESVWGGFDFPANIAANELNFIGYSSVKNNIINITPTQYYRTGAVWYKQLVSVNNGFQSYFDFKISDGKNHLDYEESEPGGDGFAFVIQNAGNNAVGSWGGGLGYAGIKNSLAIEFDTYQNFWPDDSILDPSGNHIAVFSNGKEANKPYHTTSAQIGVTSNIPLMKSSGTLYHSMIDYNNSTKILSIYLDTTGNFDKPVLEINGIDFSTLLLLDKNTNAYIGFTSATGNAWENHDITSWRFCGETPAIISDVYDTDSQLTDKDLTINPNPANQLLITNYELRKSGMVRISLFDELGVEVMVLLNEWQTLGEHNYQLSMTDYHLNNGVYFLKLTGNGLIKTEKVVIIR